MKLAEFFVSIGVDTESLKVKDLAQAIGNIPLEVVGAVAALAGLEFQVSRLAGEAMNVAVGFEAFHNQTGLSAQELQRWQIIATQANVSTETMTSSVAGLQKQLAEIRLGRGNVQPFFMMGVSPKGDAFSVLQQLRKQIPKFDRTTATNMISQMGLSPEMMNVLTLSQAKFEEFGRRVRGMTAQDEQAFLKSKLALQQLGLEFRDFSFSHLAPLASAFGDLMENLGKVHAILPAIGGLAAALGLAFAPLTTSIFVLIGLLDDLLAYKQGRKSLLGTIIGDKESKGEKEKKKEADHARRMKAVKNMPPGTDPETGGIFGIPVGKTLQGLVWEKLTGDKGFGRFSSDEENSTPAVGHKDFIPKSMGDRVSNKTEIDRSATSRSETTTINNVTNNEVKVDGSHSPYETAIVVDEHLKRQNSRAGTRTTAKQDRR